MKIHSDMLRARFVFFCTQQCKVCVLFVYYRVCVLCVFSQIVCFYCVFLEHNHGHNRTQQNTKSDFFPDDEDSDDDDVVDMGEAARVAAESDL